MDATQVSTEMNRLTKCAITYNRILALKKKKILTHAMEWMNLKAIMLSEISQL